MSGEGLRDEIAAALVAERLGLEWDDLEEDEHDDYRARADAVMAVVRPHIDAAREQAEAKLADQIRQEWDAELRDEIARAVADYQACGHCEGTCAECRGEADAILPVVPRPGRHHVTGQDGLRDEIAARVEAALSVTGDGPLELRIGHSNDLDRMTYDVFSDGHWMASCGAEETAELLIHAAADIEVLQARIDAAREHVAEQIAQALEANAARVLGTYGDNLNRAARIARRHAKGDGGGH